MEKAEKISVSDLSVGDWMQDILGNICIVRNIFCGDLVECYVVEKGDELGIMIDRLRPIPITAEVLEKNGFDAPKAKVWNDSWYWSNRKDVALELRESFGLWYMEIVTKEQRSGLQSNRKLGIGFKYVHQLQHALRLAGVEKEIEVRE